MKPMPETPDLLTLLREADPQAIRQRLDELDGEAAALRTLLRSVEARERVRQIKEGRRDG